MLLGILLTAQIIVSLALIGVVLLQRSEGGALSGLSGGPSGFMTARGAGDLLTRTTWILGAIFFALSLTLTLVAGRVSGGSSVVDRLKVDAIDPEKLSRPQAPTPTAPTPAPTSPDAAPPAQGPLQAPAPQLRNPLMEKAPAQQPAQQPAAPAQ